MWFAMNYRMLMSALAACLLLFAVACDNDDRVFDPSSVLDPDLTNETDPMLLDDDSGDGDDDDDDHCGTANGDLPDAWDDELVPDGDDDDDDDC